MVETGNIFQSLLDALPHVPAAIDAQIAELKEAQAAESRQWMFWVAAGVILILILRRKKR